MLVSPIKLNSSVSFKRALTPEELTEFDDVKQQVRKIMGYEKSVLIVPSHCLPQNPSNNTGVGNLTSKEAQKFAEFMKTYLDINAIEDLPAGELRPHGKFVCNYSASAFALSPSAIDLRTLTLPEYGSLLTEAEIKEAVNANNLSNRDLYVNFENAIPGDSPVDKALKKAYERFTESASENMKEQFEAYKTKNSEWLEPKILFKTLEAEYGHDHWQDWNEADKYLIETPNAERIKYLQDKYSANTEFYRFKQFLADKHLAQARKNINSQGLKLVGDMQIGFKPEEVWANKKAFKIGSSIGWGLPALDYDSILNEESEAAKLLKRKVIINAERYDSIRFDVSWAYIRPRVDGVSKDMGSKLIEMIERTVKEVKGKDFDLRDLIHEFDAAAKDFQMCAGDSWTPEIQGRTKALGTTYMKEGWGSNSKFMVLGRNTYDFILGVGNHDPQPLVQIAKGIPDLDGRVLKNDQLIPLKNALGIDTEILKNPVEFIKAKWGEIMLAKHRQYFYMDVFGREERFDSQLQNSEMNYRYKIPHNYEKAYFNAVESGYGFNIMDAWAKAFKTRGLENEHKTLYSKILKFRDILYEKTKEAAESKPGGKAGEVIKSKSTKAGWFIAGGAVILGGLWAYFGRAKKNTPIE